MSIAFLTDNSKIMIHFKQDKPHLNWMIIEGLLNLSDYSIFSNSI